MSYNFRDLTSVKCICCGSYLRNMGIAWLDEFEYHYRLECNSCKRLYRGHEIADAPYRPFWEDEDWKRYITLQRQKTEGESRRVNLEVLNVCRSKSQRRVVGRDMGSGRDAEGASGSVGSQVYGSNRTHRPSARRFRARRRQKS